MLRHVLSGIALALTFTTSAYAQVDTSLCEGRSGPAWGLCRAGLAVGCDVDSSQPGCAQIEDNFEKIVGSPAPWITPPPPPIVCPCEFSQLSWELEPDGPWPIAAYEFNCPTDPPFAEFYKATVGGLNDKFLSAGTFVDDAGTVWSSCQNSIDPSGFLGLGSEVGLKCREDLVNFGLNFLALNADVVEITDNCSGTLN